MKIESHLYLFLLWSYSCFYHVVMSVVHFEENIGKIRRWMVAGPEVSRLIEQFQDEHQQLDSLEYTMPS